MTDPYAHLDAAYVLGALDPAERADYERHLGACERCRAAVAEIGEVPARLDRLGPDDVLDEILDDAATVAGDDAGPVPDTLLPALVRVVTAKRRRRRLLGAAGGLLAAGCAAALVVVLLATSGTPERTPAAAAVAMQQVVPTPVHAKVALTAHGGGTRVTLFCHYAAGPGPRVDYAMVVYGRDGARHRLTSWYIQPGQDLTFAADTRIPPSDIATVEVTLDDGRPILRWAG